MSLNFAGISPHPPIIIPGIGDDADLQKVSSTILGLKKLATDFREAEIDTLIVISPHALIYPDKFNICAMNKLFGTFSEFDRPEIMTEKENDLDLVSTVVQELDKADIAHVTYDNGGEFYELDHGVMVPLYYLSQNQEYSFKVLPIAYSGLDRSAHFACGQVLKDAANKYSGRVGILASGDLSHQLLQNPEGHKFDQKLVDDLKNNRVKDILYYDDDYVGNIGECGYRSILMLLGALDQTKVSPELLSYEGPFGVGYAVFNYKLEDK